MAPHDYTYTRECIFCHTLIMRVVSRFHRVKAWRKVEAVPGQPAYICSANPDVHEPYHKSEGRKKYAKAH